MIDDLPLMSSPTREQRPLYILAPFVTTPPEVVEQMLELAGVTSADVIYDLGCGDGRIVITAAVKYGAHGVGIDIEPYRVEESRINSKVAGVEDLVTFQHGDALALDLLPATVVTLYLVQWSTNKVRQLLSSSVRPGTRVVSHNFELEGESVRSVEVTDEAGKTHKLYLWVVGDDVPSEKPQANL